MLVLLGLLLAAALPALGAPAPTVVIREPYVELHSGPGRGYPPTRALARGDQAQVLERRHGWFKLSGVAGEGWADRRALADTLEAAGISPGPQAALVDALSDRVELGLGAGLFEEDPVLRLYAGYRFRPRYAAELSYSQISGDYSSSRYFRADLVVRPWPEQTVAPHFSVGAGRFENAPRATLVAGNEDDAGAWSLGLGASGQLGPRLLLRADFRQHWLNFDGGDDEQYQELTAGFALLF